jgi:DNA-binding response OmpR family regulator
MPTAAESTLSGRRVLVVEDEYFLADDIRRILIQERAQVLGPVPTLAHGLSAVRAEAQIDCAVLDIGLGGDDVFAICAALVERNIPFVFATGFGSGRIPSEFQHVLRLEKPVEPAGLIAALRALVRPADA